jgi:hypothetical protein
VLGDRAAQRDAAAEFDRLDDRHGIGLPVAEQRAGIAVVGTPLPEFDHRLGIGPPPGRGALDAGGLDLALVELPLGIVGDHVLREPVERHPRRFLRRRQRGRRGEHHRQGKIPHATSFSPCRSR